jgi:hypothetical protein
MCNSRAIRLTTFGLLGLVVLVATGSSSGDVWGERLYDRKLDEKRRIVVDERGGLLGNPRALVAVTHNWRVLKEGENDGPILWTRRAFEKGGKTPPFYEAIEVLYADLLDGDLLTVFNERGRCFAFLVHRNEDGSFSQKPDPRGPPPPRSPFTLSVGPAMKSAEMSKGPEGLLQLVLTDGQKKTRHFQLRVWEDPLANQFVYYWHNTDPPATRPANTISEEQAIAIARDHAVRSGIKIQGIVPPEAIYEDGRWIVTFPRRLPPRTLGGGFDARITIDAESSKIIGLIEVSV